MNIGKFSVWKDRAMMYGSMYSCLMVMYLFLSKEALGLSWVEWIAILTITLLIVMVIDLKKIYPESQEYSFIRNPAWVKMVAQLERIEKKVNELEASSG